MPQGDLPPYSQINVRTVYVDHKLVTAKCFQFFLTLLVVSLIFHRSTPDIGRRVTRQIKPLIPNSLKYNNQSFPTIITGLSRTTLFAYDCHEGVCEGPDIPVDPIPLFAGLETRLRITGTGLPYPSEYTGFRIAFARIQSVLGSKGGNAMKGKVNNKINGVSDKSTNANNSNNQDQNLTYVPTYPSSCEDHIVTEIFKPLNPSQIKSPNPIALATSKLRAGKVVSAPDSTFLPYEFSSNNFPTHVDHLLFDITLPLSDSAYALCYRPSQTSRWRFAATRVQSQWFNARTYPVKSRYLLPLWLELTLVFCLFALSGLFSGLNLGLMSLDRTELRLLANSGTANEKRCAVKIAPLRKRGNFLLCTLVFGNVLVNSTLTILVENLSSGKIAVLVSTIGITLFGEIIPQAVCAKYGLEIGAKTVWITKFFMVLTAPLAYPISLVLDKVLGEDIGSVYDRQRLIELVKLSSADFGGNVLGKEEVDIITGALVMKNKTVEQIMTPVRDIYMVAYDSYLDFATLSDIVGSGYTRIPVFKNGDRKNIVGVLNVKDLAFVDPDDKIPLKTVLDFYDHAVAYVFEDTSLGAILEEFKKGSSHMAFVRKIIAQPEKDPYYEITGLVTLEDVIEEIIQGEILDETDRLLDNRNKQIRQQKKMHDFSWFIRSGLGGKAAESELQDSPMTPQMALVTYQFLNSNVDAFKEIHISHNVLRKLVRQPELLQVFSLKNGEDTVGFWNPQIDTDKSNQIYSKGVPADYFILILEGKVRVYVGQENICFESGPFSYFGINSLDALSTDEKLSKVLDTGFQLSSEALNQILKTISPFVPDYTVQALTSLLYLRVKRSQYLAALRASMLERMTGAGPTPNVIEIAPTTQTPTSLSPDSLASTVSIKIDKDDNKKIGDFNIELKPLSSTYPTDKSRSPRLNSMSLSEEDESALENDYYENLSENEGESLSTLLTSLTKPNHTNKISIRSEYSPKKKDKSVSLRSLYGEFLSRKNEFSPRNKRDLFKHGTSQSPIFTTKSPLIKESSPFKAPSSGSFFNNNYKNYTSVEGKETETETDDEVKSRSQSISVNRQSQRGKSARRSTKNYDGTKGVSLLDLIATNQSPTKLDNHTESCKSPPSLKIFFPDS
ncbi:unextended protein-like isoform X2 [Gordionus sp. m RMFG-2023]|uniref:unextended protein-like isoform X2 n=1 Tax=Gordionus sp. m RMFG-2023 TaxID=3053472 RepID=UPI0031FC229B